MEKAISVVSDYPRFTQTAGIKKTINSAIRHATLPFLFPEWIMKEAERKNPPRVLCSFFFVFYIPLRNMPRVIIFVS